MGHVVNWGKGAIFYEVFRVNMTEDLFNILLLIMGYIHGVTIVKFCHQFVAMAILTLNELRPKFVFKLILLSLLLFISK